MAGRTYFFSIFALISLTGGLAGKFNPERALAMLAGFAQAIGGVLVVLLAVGVLIAFFWLATQQGTK